MKLWEYDVIDLALSAPEVEDAASLKRFLNERGAMEWELVSHNPATLDGDGNEVEQFIFKRQLGGDDGIYLP